MWRCFDIPNRQVQKGGDLYIGGGEENRVSQGYRETTATEDILPQVT